jgi:hypothetical protein
MSVSRWGERGEKERGGGERDHDLPHVQDCVKVHDLDVLVAASGFKKEHAAEFDEVCE